MHLSELKSFKAKLLIGVADCPSLELRGDCCEQLVNNSGKMLSVKDLTTNKICEKWITRLTIVGKNVTKWGEMQQIS